ncbi:hypothetical protein F5H01DRAFT_340215 [Linnemannia elongata]|nr:hypothetical protein F5H01DRAFT_340215 [Linnemannia elongata]
MLILLFFYLDLVSSPLFAPFHLSFSFVRNVSNVPIIGSCLDTLSTGNTLSMGMPSLLLLRMSLFAIRHCVWYA